MANVFNKNPITLDTFTGAIDVVSSSGLAAGLKLQSIEWQTPTNTSHTAAITDNGGNPFFAEQCTVANQSVIKYYDGVWVDNLKIAISGVGSGKIVITLL